MKVIYFLFILALTTIIISVVTKKEIITIDSVEYFSLAKNLKKGVHYAGDLTQKTDFRLFNKRPIGYPIFLILNPSSLGRKIIQLCIILFCFFIGLAILNTETNSTVLLRTYTAFYFLSLPLWFSASFMMGDLWMMAIVSTIWFFLLKWHADKNRYWKNLIILLIFIGLLFKPVMIPISVFLILPFAFRLFYKRKLEIMWLLPFFLILFYSWFHSTKTGRFEYSSISTTNLAQYNARWLISSEFGEDSAASFLATHHIGVPRSPWAYAKYQDTLYKTGKKVILSKPLSYSKIHLAGMLKCVLDPGMFETKLFIRNNPLLDEPLTPLIYSGDWGKIFKIVQSNLWMFSLLLFSLLLGLLRLLGLVLVLKYWRRPVVYISLLTIGYFVFFTGPLGSFRFLIPVFVPTLVLAVLGLALWINRFKKSPVG